MVEIKWLQFQILYGADCVWCHSLHNEYDDICPFLVVVLSKHRDVASPDLVEGGFGERHHEIVVFNFSAVYAVVALVTTIRVLADHFDNCDRDHKENHHN